MVISTSRRFVTSMIAFGCLLALIAVSVSSTKASPTPYVPQPHMLTNLNSASSSSEPSYLTEFSDQIYFQANDGQHGYEIWRSDGMPEGTYQVLEIYTGTGITEGAYPSQFANP